MKDLREYLHGIIEDNYTTSETVGLVIELVLKPLCKEALRHGYEHSPEPEYVDRLIDYWIKENIK